MTKEELIKRGKEEWWNNTFASGGTSPQMNYAQGYKDGYIAGATETTKELQELYRKADENWWNAQQTIKELQEQIEEMKKYGKLLQDICTVMGNDVYMVSVGLENRVKVLWDSSEEKDGLKMVEDIENRLLEIKPQEWAEIEKWEIKEK